MHQHIQFPGNAARVSESRTAGLLSAAGVGPEITEAARDLALESGPSKRLIRSRFGPRDLARRDLSAGVATAGGYLIGTTNMEPEPFMDRLSIVRQSGARIITGLSGPVTRPRRTAKGTAYWVPEFGTVTETQPTLGQLSASPKFVSIHEEASRQLLLQSSAKQFIEEDMDEATAQAIDAAAIAGTGVAGQPAGILNTAGIGSVSGTSLSIVGIMSMVASVLAAGAMESRLTFFGAPDVRELLGKRENFAGAGPLWTDGKLAGYPAVASLSVPAGTLLLGDWSRLSILIFDANGVEIMTNPYADFKAGIVGLMMTVPVDFMVSPAAAFCKSSSIT